MKNWFIKNWDKIFTKNSGLIRSGNWRVQYTDGSRSKWLDYTSAVNLAEVYGGRLEHKCEVGKQ